MNKTEFVLSLFIDNLFARHHLNNFMDISFEQIVQTIQTPADKEQYIT